MECNFSKILHLEMKKPGPYFKLQRDLTTNEHLACFYPLKYVIHCKYLQSSKDQVAVLSCVTLMLTYFVLTRGCSGKKS